MSKNDTQVEQFRVTPSNPLDFHSERFPTRLKGFCKDQIDYEHKLGREHERMAVYQEMLAANKSSAFLVGIQALDAAGKDGLVKHGFAGLNVVGSKVVSFKAPTPSELKEGFLDRHTRALPGPGELGIWIRTHFEEVSAVRVHPQFLKGRGIDLNTINDSFWEKRLHEIRAWEDALAERKIGLVKIFLNASTGERQTRLLERLEDPDKHWKSSLRDSDELKFVPQYEDAFAAAINATSTDRSPWYVLPADSKKTARILGAQVLNHELGRLNLRYPERSTEERRQIDEAARQLRMKIKN